MSRATIFCLALAMLAGCRSMEDMAAPAFEVGTPYSEFRAAVREKWGRFAIPVRRWQRTTGNNVWVSETWICDNWPVTRRCRFTFRNGRLYSISTNF